MAKCNYCGTTIFMGGVRAGTERYCNNKCFQGARVMAAVRNVPADAVDRQVQEIFRGSCPICRGPGPVDVHKIHRVWSALILTQWSSSQKVCCRSCAVKSQTGGILFCATLGWWGIPWGLILTPVQISRNIAAMCGGPNSNQPSPELLRLVQVTLGAKILQNQQPANVPPRIAPK